ncbi:MAG: T9SS type A sorting domain-containing protein [bacterium]|nr:T9SS type A sorting domain-containing protein [bacterium]
MITVTHNDMGSPLQIPVSIEVALDADDNVELPTEFALHANYPNPFNATTALSFDVPNESRVQITIFNVAGQEVARPVNEVMAAGSHTVLYTADNLPTGMYLVKMTAGSFSAVQKMVLLK